MHESLDHRFRINVCGESVDFEIHPENETLSNVVRTDGLYSRHDIEMMRRILRPGDLFVDAGANIGWHSLLASRWVGSSGHVYAFEPALRSLNLLQKNLANNYASNVTVVPCALSAVSGRAELSLSQYNFGDNIMLFKQKEIPGHSSIEPIECISFDEFIKTQNLEPQRIRMIKMDVQGAEIDVIEGMRNFLEHHRPHLIVEYSPKHLRYRGRSHFDFFSFIDRYAYRPFLIETEKNKVPSPTIYPLSVEDLFKLTQQCIESSFDLGFDLYLEPHV